MFRDKAIRNTHPTVVTIRGNGSTAVDTNGDVVVLDESLISTEMARLQAEYDSQEYARNRKAEYDQLNQFEMQFDDDRDGTTTWVDKINEIKGRHPK
jgi:hypothetical protein